MGTKVTRQTKMKNIVLFVDIPDPDNLCMIIMLLHHCRRDMKYGSKVSIVLSPRAVDLRAPPYRGAFMSIRKALGDDTKRLVMPIRDPDRLKRLHDTVPDEVEHLKQWLYIDEGCEEKTGSIREDSELYMQLSILYIVRILKELGYGDKDYEIYCDYSSLDVDESENPPHEKLGDPAMRHAVHAHDYRYGFDDELLDEYGEILSKYEKRPLSELGTPNTELREALHALMEDQKKRLETGRNGLGSVQNLFKDFEVLLEEVRSGSHSRVDMVIGGPFTEAARYLEVLTSKLAASCRPGSYPITVTAMAASRNRGLNILPEQFNFWVDSFSAQKFLELAVKCQIETVLVPTECVKEATLRLGSDEALKLTAASPRLGKMVRMFLEDTRSKVWNNFDGVTAVAYMHRDFLERLSVEYSPFLVHLDENEEQIKERRRDNKFLEPDASKICNYYIRHDFQEKRRSVIKLARLDEAREDEYKNVLLQEMRKCISRA